MDVGRCIGGKQTSDNEGFVVDAARRLASGRGLMNNYLSGNVSFKCVN